MRTAVLVFLLYLLPRLAYTLTVDIDQNMDQDEFVWAHHNICLFSPSGHKKGDILTLPMLSLLLFKAQGRKDF